jgi:DNA primase
MIGIDPVDVQREVRRTASRASSAVVTQVRPASELPDPRDPRLMLERETLKLVVQYPAAVGRIARDVGAEDFTHGAYRALWAGIEKAGGPTAADPQWASTLRDAQTDERLQSLISALTVEPLLSAKEPDDAYVGQHVHRLRELTAMRRIADLKSRLQRTNPVDQAVEYNRMFGELVALEQHRRSLRERALESQ